MQAGSGILKMETLLEKQGVIQDISTLNVADSNSLRSYAVPAHCLTLPPSRTLHCQDPPGPGLASTSSYSAGLPEGSPCCLTTSVPVCGRWEMPKVCPKTVAEGALPEPSVLCALWRDLR